MKEEIKRSAKAISAILLISSLLFAGLQDINRARQLEREGKYQEAISLYLKDRKEKKDEKIYAQELFRLYLHLKNIKSARKELKKIPVKEWQPLAKFCEEKGLINLAKEIYQELERSGTPQPLPLDELYYNQAKPYLKEGKIKEAIKEIASLPRETEKKFYYLAKFFFLAEEFDSALKYTFELARRFPKSDLRNSLYELNLLATTVEDIKPLIRAYLHIESGENKKAEEVLKKIDMPYAKVLLAQIYFAEKKTELAIKLLEETIYKDTTGFFASKALLDLAKIYQAINDEQRAMVILEELITRYPSSPFAPIARSLLKPEKRGGVH